GDLRRVELDGVGQFLRREAAGGPESQHVLHRRGGHIRRRLGGRREVARVVPLVAVDDAAEGGAGGVGLGGARAGAAGLLGGLGRFPGRGAAGGPDSQLVLHRRGGQIGRGRGGRGEVAGVVPRVAVDDAAGGGGGGVGLGGARAGAAGLLGRLGHQEMIRRG